MSNQSPDNGNVIQFPGGKKSVQPQPAPSRRAAPANKNEPVLPKGKAQITFGAMILAIALATGAVNQHVFDSTSGSADLSSMAGSASKSSRSIASVDRMSFTRNAEWEKELAEALAQSSGREVASVAQLGRDATIEEKLRWGVLEEKYTIVYLPENHKISSILLQNADSPSYILDRMKFLENFGSLFDGEYESAKLDSSTAADGKTFEVYTLYGQDQRPAAQAKFELDRHQRLLSLNVEQR